MERRNTKEMREYYERYKRATATTLRDVYATRWSEEKEDAFKYCVNLMNEYKGHDLRIVSANGYKFSAGFVYEKDGRKFYVHITKEHDRETEV